MRDLAGPPNHWDEATTRHNVLNKYRADQIRGTDFDPESIMLYFFPGTWVKSGIGTHANEVLSAIDKAYIASAQAYPKTAPTVVDALPTEGERHAAHGGIDRQGGRRGPVQVQVTAGGTHIIDTRGPTDVVMKLFGPNSHTNVIAEDDDSGVDTNALIRGRPDSRRVLRAGAALQQGGRHRELHDQGAEQFELAGLNQLEVSRRSPPRFSRYCATPPRCR